MCFSDWCAFSVSQKEQIVSWGSGSGYNPFWTPASCHIGGNFFLRFQASEQNMHENKKSFFVPYCNAGIMEDRAVIVNSQTDSGNNLGYHCPPLGSGRRIESTASLSFHWPYIPLWNQINNYRLIKWTCKLPISEFSLGHDNILRWQHPMQKNKNQWIWPFWPLLRILSCCILHFKFHFATNLIF